MSHKLFSQELQDVKDEILLLSSMVEQAIMDSVSALKDRDLEQARQILARDRDINRKRFELEISIMVLIATQQPIAHDLRLLAAGLNICTELERMADYAKGIATINLRSGGLSWPCISVEVYRMAEEAANMLHRAMTAFVREDLPTAQAIIREDDLIDEYYSKLYSQAIHSVLENARNIERANYIIWTAHNLERVGDRVTNICERIIYIVTGEQPEEAALHQETKLDLGEYAWRI